MKDIEKILTTKVKVLVYSGDMNWYNNWYGQRDWLSRLDWESKVEFNNKKEENWFSYVSGRKAGTVKKYLNLAFVRVFNAGYYVS
jgi:cathepsin A (carboxypeptidase C)